MKNLIFYLFLSLITVFSHSGYAADYEVTSDSDANVAGTITHAINTLNGMGPGPHVINITTAGPIVLNSSLPAILVNVTINGNGVLIDGDENFRAIEIGNNINFMPGNLMVVINDITFFHCTANQGGAIFAHTAASVVTISNCFLIQIMPQTKAEPYGAGDRLP